MTPSASPSGLNVIALVSGGKDSFFSLLHCRANGHHVVALANLHPPLPVPLPFPKSGSSSSKSPPVDPAAASTPEAASAVPGTHHDQDGAVPPAKPLSTPEASSRGPEPGAEPSQDEEDLNSFMYQTVGHQVIPLYAEATGIPLYRRAITGGAGQHGKDYGHLSGPGGAEEEEEDETESMIPLLREIKEKHPEANAICAGAILSTYQRTRVESVAVRLGLVPVAYLWKYPVLPAPEPSPWGEAGDEQLLDDMAAVGMEVRIIKVASGGLDESFLWTNLASVRGKQRVKAAMRRFGVQETGAVIGEGGEFETLVLDAPFFKKRVVVEEGDWRVVQEGGGSAWLMLRNARLEEKEAFEGDGSEVIIPGQLDVKFKHVLADVREMASAATLAQGAALHSERPVEARPPLGQLRDVGKTHLHQWCFVRQLSTGSASIEEETKFIVEKIRQKLSHASLTPSAIINTTILLRQMTDFPTVNKIYGALFDAPNPPSRVTVSCGDLLSSDPSVHIAVYLSVNDGLVPGQRQGLHVQSRSYWAPANIGPYSQAITVPVASLASNGNGSPHLQSSLRPTRMISIAGQIPLVPATMALPLEGSLPLQLTLSLQHLWRIGLEMGVQWWSSAVAYFPRCTPSDIPMSSKAQLASKAWEMAHLWSAKSSDEDDDEAGPDLWDQRYNPDFHTFVTASEETDRARLPYWDVIDLPEMGVDEKKRAIPLLFSAEVAELPRAAAVEWHAHVGFSEVVEMSMSSWKAWKARSLADGGVEVYHCTMLDAASGILFVQTIVVQGLGDVTMLGTGDMDKIARGSIAMLSKDGGAELGAEGTRVVARYVVVSAGDVGVNAGDGPVVPCASLWDSMGRALGSVTVHQSVFECGGWSGN
ncbi:hypothetical protein QBC34DRAFT_299237 [Podospora aff. communis PSN243]|uniref:Diphthine--ammonia ligase n=1 Tax=Podospora aff. communis PSN243 TaxID=3040156 RepID=A0AAV9GS83_9PEZI|nr:hypothetical protein QBC34DRAFT_299237 [Podospora aff. communis PSN243]